MCNVVTREERYNDPVEAKTIFGVSAAQLKANLEGQ